MTHLTLLEEAQEEITALEYISYHGLGVDDDHGLWFADLVADDISKIHSLILALVDRVEALERAIRHELGVTHGEDTIRRLRAVLFCTNCGGSGEDMNWLEGVAVKCSRCGGSGEASNQERGPDDG